MNLFALLPFSAFILNIILGSYIFSQDTEKRINKLYSLFTFTIATWALGDFLVLMSPSFEMALYGDKIALIGASFMPAFLLHFFIVFTKKKLISRKIYLFLLYLPAFFFLVLTLFTDLLAATLKQTWWGYVTVPGPFYNILSLSATLYVLIAIFLGYRLYAKARFDQEKRQAKLLLIAIAIPAVGGIITQVIPPLLGYETIRLTTTLTTVSAAIIAYAMAKYRLLAITSAMAADKIISTMDDYMVVTDKDKNIALINQSFQDALGAKKQEIIGRSLDIIAIKSRGLFTKLEEKGIVKDYETEILDLEKKSIPIAINASKMKNNEGSTIGYIFVIRDISHTKELIHNLKEKRKELEKSKKELEKKAYELSKFHDIVIGRELKLVELRKSLKELKKVIKNETPHPKGMGYQFD